MRAVRKHTNSKWIILYIERWLKAPIKTTDGQLQFMEKGVFQGNVISPLLANLFLHYALDVWLKRNYPNNPYERYADDELVHCRTLTEAKEMWVAIERRLAECGLKLHSEKTKIVYCKDGQRKLAYHNKEFDFLIRICYF
jgi:RNA-directed DNA polymerase